MAWHEQRRITDDGAIWPFARVEMTAGPCIRERMAEDIRTLAKEAGEFATVADEAIIAFGWSPEQVRLYGMAAARQAFPQAAETACGNDPAPGAAA